MSEAGVPEVLRCATCRVPQTVRIRWEDLNVSCPQRGTPWVWGFSGIGCTERGVPKARGTLGMGEPRRTVGRPKRESPWEQRVGVRCAGTDLHGVGHAAPSKTARSRRRVGSRSRAVLAASTAAAQPRGGGGGAVRALSRPQCPPPPSFASRAARPRGQKTGMEWRLANRSRLKARAAGERGGAGRGSWPGFFQTEPGVP